MNRNVWSCQSALIRSLADKAKHMNRKNSIRVSLGMPILAGLLMLWGMVERSWAEDREPVVVIHAGAVLETPGKAPLANQTIVVHGNRIAEIRPGFIPAESFGDAATFVDLSQQFVLPGLSDMHMHLGMSLGAEARPPGRVILESARHAREMLEAGITLVRDVGDPSDTTFVLRDAINEGVVPGPRVFAAGRLVSRTGGHGVERYVRGVRVETAQEPATCDGMESCRRVVRENVERGSDLIKVTASGSVSDEWGTADAGAALFPDEMDAIAMTARQLHRPVAVHAHGPQSINLALRAGARTIEHGTYFDEESVRLFKKNGAYLVPTVYISDFIIKNAARFQARNTPADWEILKNAVGYGRAGAGRAWRAGIKLATGTDTGMDSDVQSTITELQIFVEEGIPAGEAIKASTMHGAQIVGKGNELGQIQPGYLADIIATSRSPLEDIANLHSVTFVMKDGRIYKR